MQQTKKEALTLSSLHCRKSMDIKHSISGLTFFEHPYKNMTSLCLNGHTWRPIVIIQPGMQHMSIIICAYRVAIK